MDNWRPSAALEQLKARATLLRDIREFFYARDVLEVETPLLASRGVSDPHVLNFRVFHHREDRCTGFLQTSPEYAMKRLLSAGAPSIYQLGKAFRDEEQGRLHNAEFTLLEWYRLDWDHHQLMAEISDLLAEILGTSPATKLSYFDSFQTFLEVDVSKLDDQALQNLVQERAPLESPNEPRDTLLQWLFTSQIEPHLGHDAPCFIYDYPISQAALARASSDDTRCAHRFELFIQGVELGNGFYELRDPLEQKRRFEHDNQQRVELGLPTMEIDEKLIAALASGFPDCSGFALGIDRLLMLQTDAKAISDGIAFDSRTC